MQDRRARRSTHETTPETVHAFFEQEAERGRRLLPDPATVGGLGTVRKYEWAASVIAGSAGRRVLDLGCSRGSVEAVLRSRHPEANDVQVVGVDVVEPSVRMAAALSLPNCSFLLSDGATLPFPSGTFDLVISVEVLEHIMDKAAVLREVWRVLKPEGRLFLTTPNPECWALRTEAALWGTLRAAFRKPQPAKDAYIAQGALRALLREAGFMPEPGGAKAYTWPHAFVKFEGWGLLPPAPPRLLYGYQQLCLRYLEGAALPDWLERRLKWTLVAQYRKACA